MAIHDAGMFTVKEINPSVASVTDRSGTKYNPGTLP